MRPAKSAPSAGSSSRDRKKGSGGSAKGSPTAPPSSPAAGLGQSPPADQGTRTRSASAFAAGKTKPIYQSYDENPNVPSVAVASTYAGQKPSSKPPRGLGFGLSLDAVAQIQPLRRPESGEGFSANRTISQVMSELSCPIPLGQGGLQGTNPDPFLPGSGRISPISPPSGSPSGR